MGYTADGLYIMTMTRLDCPTVTRLCDLSYTCHNSNLQGIINRVVHKRYLQICGRGLIYALKRVPAGQWNFRTIKTCIIHAIILLYLKYNEITGRLVQSNVAIQNFDVFSDKSKRLFLFNRHKLILEHNSYRNGIVLHLFQFDNENVRNIQLQSVQYTLKCILFLLLLRHIKCLLLFNNAHCFLYQYY